MDLVLSIVLTLCIIIIYIIMIQVFTVLFRITGLTKEKARFQVISLLTNSGYTTSESEIITNNRRRRKIATSCMITGTIFNVLIVSLIINIFLSFKPMTQHESYYILGIAFLVFIALLITMRIPIVKRAMERFIEAIANKIDHSGKKENIITTLDIYGNDSIVEVHINVLPDFMENKGLNECHLKSRYNLNVLLIKRNNRIIDVKADTIIEKNDSVVIFGNTQNIKDIFALKATDVSELVDCSRDNIVNLIENHGKMAMTEVIVKHVPASIKGLTLSEGPLKSKYNLNVLMQKRNNEGILVSAESTINEGDTLIIFGPYKNIKELFLEENYEISNQA